MVFVWLGLFNRRGSHELPGARALENNNRDHFATWWSTQAKPLGFAVCLQRRRRKRGAIARTTVQRLPRKKHTTHLTRSFCFWCGRGRVVAARKASPFTAGDSTAQITHPSCLSCLFTAVGVLKIWVLHTYGFSGS